MQPQLAGNNIAVLKTHNKKSMPDNVDVLIVGAGIAGICAAYYLQKYCPEMSFTILEARETLGGTWDQFRYPGVRSDSDAFTLSFSFKPWRRPEAIACGDVILEYIKEAAEEVGLKNHTHFRHKVSSASWDSGKSLWTANVQDANGDLTKITCKYLYMCTGYFDQETGYQPEWEGRDKFQGDFVHPQNWPENLDYAGKKVVVIGSGATAISMIPEIAKTAGHTIMLQRSPTYIFSRRRKYLLTNILRYILPTRVGFAIARTKAGLSNLMLYQICRRMPGVARFFVKMHNRRKLGYKFDTTTHFTPRYAPWDQRFCLDADSDFFKSVREGRATIVTDHISHFVEDGIILKSGEKLEADIIVSSTGLNMRIMGGIDIQVDGQPINTGKLVNYKGVMFGEVPNLINAQGHVNASWTLRCEYGAAYFTRLMKHMEKKKYTVCTPRNHENDIDDKTSFFLRSGYVMRARHHWPKQGKTRPWKVYDNQFLDQWALSQGEIDDGVLEFS
ncbi:MAG: flavin-containing monooxygenase [Methyloligellaceae bacterium]